MEGQAKPSHQQEHGKVVNWKRKGKLTELDRLKKRQKELQIMKLSQEWDARRQKRRMDRIQWLQQRKNHTLPSSQLSEVSGTRSEEGSSNEYDDEHVLLAKANSSPVSTDSSHQILYDEPREIEVETEVKSQVEEESGKKRKQCEDDGQLGSNTTCEQNQGYQSVVVKAERQDSDRFCNANESKQVPPMSNSKNSYRTLHEASKKRRKEENQELHSKTNENQFSHPRTQENESNQVGAYQRLVTMVNTHPPGVEDRFANNSVIVQAMKQSGLDENELDEPNLLMASEPVRFEDVLRRGGTNIQRLETRTVDLMSKHSSSRPSQQHTDKTPLSRPHSRNSSIKDTKKIHKVEDNQKNQSYPKIKQCYSLIGGKDKSKNSPLASPNSTGNPVSTMASSSPECFTDKNEARFHPVAQTPSTSSQPCPPSGYLVPIYKPSADEVVYAFVPNSDDRTHPRAPDPGKMHADEYFYTESDPRYTGQIAYSTIRTPTATIHHGRNMDSVPRTSHAQKLTESHQPTNVTWVNAPISSVAEKREFTSKTPVSGIAIKATAHDKNDISGNLQRRNDRHSHRETEIAMKARHTPSPNVTVVNGYSSVQTAHAPEPPNKGRTAMSSPLDSPPNDSINNPTAIYVRPKLVPREIVVPHHSGTGNVPIVEYIKTDAICNKDLGSWTAKNVAEFIAATDCSDSAKIFIEQDIDGKAVLLLSQNIFVNRLNLKLGTAIKLYNHIANLRTALLM